MPDPNVNVNVNVDVNDNDGCNGCSSMCMFDSKEYKEGDILEDSCFVMQCIKGGKWKYLGEAAFGCGRCDTLGDPHISPFQLHNLTNPTRDNSATVYADYQEGNMCLSQIGLGKIPELVGVAAKFEKCLPQYTNSGDYSCVSEMWYVEPGMLVKLILPEELNNFTHCVDSTNAGDPKCSKTTILVNGDEVTIDDSSIAKEFPHPNGKLLIFKDKCNKEYCSIFFIGTKGYAVNLIVDIKSPERYDLYTYAWPTLANKIYGLCDVFTGERSLVDTLTPRYGKGITDWDDLSDFTTSWEII